MNNAHHTDRTETMITQLDIPGTCIFCGRSVDAGNDVVPMTFDGAEWVPANTPEVTNAVDSRPNGRGGFTAVRIKVARVAGPVCAAKHLSDDR